jgi:hypothetical protein
MSTNPWPGPVDMIDAAAFDGIGEPTYDDSGDGRVNRYARWKQGSCPECRQPMPLLDTGLGGRCLRCVNPACQRDDLPIM